MDKKERQLHPLDICNRLYNFVTKTVSAHAFKTVKLGHPMHQNLAKPENGARAIHESNHKLHHRTQGVAPGFEDVKQASSLKNSNTSASSCSSSNDHERDGKELPAVQENDASHGTRPQEEAPLPFSLVPQAKPAKIKKNVSISDRVEEIDTRGKMKRRKSTEKLPSIDLEEDIVQPVKSILKKDSDSGGRLNSLDHCDLGERSFFFIHCD